MTRLQLEFDERTYLADLAKGHDISIAVDFEGPQPGHFGAARAASEPMRARNFIGDTRQGGSCNAAVISINPHCNGTHTECLGHVTKSRNDVLAAAPAEIMPAILLSVEPELASDSDEASWPEPRTADRLITANALAKEWKKQPGGDYPALVVRTLPNSQSKRTSQYTERLNHPYFSLDAIEMLVDRGVQHLLVDTPSVDRFNDEGRLSGHRLFWGLGPKAVEAGPEARRGATITEMIFVDNEVEDGIYLLNLQIAPFLSDAAPSRPILFPASAA